MNRTRRMGALVVAACSLGASLPGTAVEVTLTQALGYSMPGTAANPVQDAALVNAVVDRANGAATSTYDAVGHTYTVVSAPATPYPYATATLWGAVGGDDSVNLGAGGYKYLLVKYDGENGTAQIWDVAGMTGEVGVPARDTENKTSNNYTLFGAVAVPDGGSTLALTGLGMLAFGLMQRKSR